MNLNLRQKQIFFFFFNFMANIELLFFLYIFCIFPVRMLETGSLRQMTPFYTSPSRFSPQNPLLPQHTHCQPLRFTCIFAFRTKTMTSLSRRCGGGPIFCHKTQTKRVALKGLTRLLSLRPQELQEAFLWTELPLI